MSEFAEPGIQQLFDISGRVALVTGGAGYLGRSIAAALAEGGATVVVGSRDLARATETAEQLSLAAGAGHFGIQLDHKDPPSIEQAVSEIVNRCGQIDILFNNGQGGAADDWTTISDEQFRDQLANAAGYFRVARAVRDQAVLRSAPASIVLLGSMYGMVASYPDAYDGICAASSVGYHALKGGIIQMTRHLAIYWAADQVRVNCLSPGPFPSPQAPPEMVTRLCGKSPMKRMGKPHELKGAALFLASDASSYVTGQNLVVDGGWTAW